MPSKVKYISKITPVKFKTDLGLNVRLEVSQIDSAKSFVVYSKEYALLHEFSQEITPHYESLDRCNSITDIQNILKEITEGTTLTVNLLSYSGLHFFELVGERE